MKVWAYIHPDLDILCCALLYESVPQGVEAIELEVDSPDDVIYDNGVIRLKTAEEKQEEMRKRKIEEIQQEVRMYLQKIESMYLSKYTEGERLSFDAKVEEAKIILSGENLPTPILDNEIEIQYGQQPNEQLRIQKANEIMQKRQIYTILTGRIAGVRKYIESNLLDLSIEELTNFNVRDYIISVFSGIVGTEKI